MQYWLRTSTPTFGSLVDREIKAMFSINFWVYVHKNRVKNHSNSLNKSVKEIRMHFN